MSALAEAPDYASAAAFLLNGLSQLMGELTSKAGSVLARLASFEGRRGQSERLQRDRDRLTLMVDSLPDAVVITNAGNDIIAQNRRAEYLLAFGEDDSPGRRRAVEMNNLLFTSFLSRAAMVGGGVRGSGWAGPSRWRAWWGSVRRSRSCSRSNRRRRRPGRQRRASTDRSHSSGMATIRYRPESNAGEWLPP